MKERLEKPRRQNHPSALNPAQASTSHDLIAHIDAFLLTKWYMKHQFGLVVCFFPLIFYIFVLIAADKWSNAGKISDHTTNLIDYTFPFISPL